MRLKAGTAVICAVLLSVSFLNCKADSANNKFPENCTRTGFEYRGDSVALNTDTQSSQGLYLLDANVRDPKSYLKPELFRSPWEPREPTRASHPEENPWKPVSREELFLDDSIRRLCLTTDAGVGKTTTLQWVEQAMGRRRPVRLALLLEMRHLPWLRAG